MKLLIIILIPLSFFYKLNIIGELYFAHILLFCLSFFFLINRDIILNNLQRKILYLILIWFVVQSISNYINHVEFDKNIKGLARIFFFGVSFFVFFHINNNKNTNYLIELLFAYSIFNIIFILTNNVTDIFLIWKMGGLALSVTILAILLFTKNIINSSIIMFVIFVSISIISLILESRVFFILNILNSVIVLFIRKENIRTIIYKSFLLNIIIFSLIIIFILNFYEYLFLNDFLTDRLTNKQIQQSGELGILLGGRVEFLSSFNAIMDKFFLGHGSWATNCEYKIILFDKLFSLNYVRGPYINTFLDNCLIPAHSFLTQSWIESGIFGFIFWIYIIYIICNKFLKSMKMVKEYDLLIVFLFIYSLWTILFSPFGSFGTLLMPLYICIIMKDNINE
tara:strand:+ start:2351 stop:3538 length:1188 start_codon:yes stop_codon:yes gene_type:complete